MSIAEKSTIISANNVTIIENEQKVYKAGQLKTLQDSEYMNAKVSGTAIVVTDVNSIEHNVKCNVASKNLLNPRDFVDTSVGGIVTVNEDGSVYLYSISGKDIETQITYTFDVTEKSVLSLSDDGSPDLLIFIDDQNTEEDHKVLDIGTHTLKLRLPESTSATVYIQLEKGTTPTPYTPYLADFSGIEVSRYGKNLAQAEDVYKDASEYAITTFEGRKCVRFLDNVAFNWNGIPFKENTQYTVSFDVRITHREETATQLSALFYFFYSDGTSSRLTSYRNTEWEHFTLTSTAGKTVTSIGLKSYGFFNWPYIDCNSFQLEISSTTTPYEPYIEPTVHTANADGTVDGIKSISPNMTLLTNNNNVVINANYLRDIDTYIDNLITNVALTGGE